MKRIHSIIYIVSLYLILVSTAAFADKTVERRYLLANYGEFVLQAPESWRDEVRQPYGGMPPTIVFTSPKTSFQILLTPMFAAQQGMVMPSLPDIKANVAMAAEKALSQSVETTIDVREINEPSAKGYFFSATDRAPTPGEYKYITQGMLRVGKLAPTFTILTNDGEQSIIEQALDMLAGAAHIEK